jgi:4-hydroxybenzoate polyprenyltransferase
MEYNTLVMQNILKYLKAWSILLRFENLIMIAVAMWIMNSYVVNTKLQANGILVQCQNTAFWILVLSVVLIAAGGYAINDYFDIRTDEINRPHRVILNKIVKRRSAIVAHFGLSLCGLLLAVYLAFKVHYLRMLVYHGLAIFLLWTYSTHFKKNWLIGNIIIALLSAAVLTLPLVYAFGFYNINLNNFSVSQYWIVSKPILLYALFAFLISFSRELVKDLEDVKGDQMDGANTFPIYAGVMPSKMLFTFSNVLSIVFLSFILYNTITYTTVKPIGPFLYILFLLFCPIFVTAVLIWPANTSGHFKYLSWALKSIMFLGLLFAVFFIT